MLRVFWYECVSPTVDFRRSLYASAIGETGIPRWIAGSGDIVRALLSANQFDDNIDYVPTLEWMLRWCSTGWSYRDCAGL